MLVTDMKQWVNFKNRVKTETCSTDSWNYMKVTRQPIKIVARDALDQSEHETGKIL